MFILWITAEHASRLLCFLIVRPLVGRRGNMANRFFSTKQFQHWCFNWFCQNSMRAFNSYEKQLVLGTWLVDKRKRNRARKILFREKRFFLQFKRIKTELFFVSGRRFALTQRIILKCTFEFTQALQLLYVYGFNGNLRNLYFLA